MTRPWSRVLLLVSILLVLVSTGCGSSDSPRQGSGDRGDGQPSPSAIPATVSPVDGSTAVAPATPVVVELARGELSAVEVRSDGGDTVTGRLTSDRKQWSSRGKLVFGDRYTVRVTLGDESTPRVLSRFSTAPKPSAGDSVRVSSQLGDGKTYGVAMPIVLKLDHPLSTAAQRAAFERTLSVRSAPPTVGAWGWVNNREVQFRPRLFWPAGTTVRIAVDTAGRPLGDGSWGRTDLKVEFRIGVSRELRVDAASKRMQVIEAGRVVRTVPVSLGRPQYPSSSGTLVVIEKRPEALFDSSTYGLPVDSPDGYRTKVQYPIRLTWGGEFIHAAPWSVADQGRRNVSHGCVNVSPEAAAWLYARVQVGDPVIVRNTGQAVRSGDGWTTWNAEFGDWLRNSATGQRSTG